MRTNPAGDPLQDGVWIAGSVRGVAGRPAFAVRRRLALRRAVRGCAAARAAVLPVSQHAARPTAGIGCGGVDNRERARKQDGGCTETKCKLEHDLTSLCLSSKAGVTTGGVSFRLGLARQ